MRQLLHPENHMKIIKTDEIHFLITSEQMIIFNEDPLSQNRWIQIRKNRMRIRNIASNVSILTAHFLVQNIVNIYLPSALYKFSGKGSRHNLAA